MMWEADTMMQVRMSKFVKISYVFICIYEKIAGCRGGAPDPVVTAVCLYI